MPSASFIPAFPLQILYKLINSSRNLRNLRVTRPKSLRGLGYGRCLSERTEREENLWTDSIALESIAEEGFQTGEQNSRWGRTKA